MGDRVSDYKDLKVWQLAMQIAKKTYQLTTAFPKDQTYVLIPQMQRAAISIASNIAEGNAREVTKDYIRFISIAQGSASELETQIILAKELGYISGNDSTKILEDIIVIRKMLNKLRNSLKLRLNPTPHHPTPITKE